MLGLGKKNPIHEHEATGEIERVYHEIKQSLRVSGVNLNFRSWAAHGGFLPLMWDAIRLNVETRAFETAADEIRAEAARAAEALGPLEVTSFVALGESQLFQIRAALDLYHYINPKLLVLTSAVALSLRGEAVGQEAAETPERIARGAPAAMYPMEMESEHPDDHDVRRLYKDIQETLSLPSVNSDYRTLAMWPEYLAAAWACLEPIVGQDSYLGYTESLREKARSLARALPYSLRLTRESVRSAGADPVDVLEVTSSFERLLPGLILHVALFQRDFLQGIDLAASPFPAPSHAEAVRGVS